MATATRYTLLTFALAATACSGDEPTSDGVHSQAQGSGMLFSYLVVLFLVCFVAALAYRFIKRGSQKR